MPSSAIIVRRAIAVALMALAPAAGLAAQAHQPGIIAQSSDDDDDSPPPRRRGVPVESDEPAERAEEKPFPGMGASRRLDPFDANDERPRSAQAPPPAAAANPGHDVVVCEAGCDGPRGAVVYKKEK
jgi:hypothetical protein